MDWLFIFLDVLIGIIGAFFGYNLCKTSMELREIKKFREYLEERDKKERMD